MTIMLVFDDDMQKAKRANIVLTCSFEKSLLKKSKQTGKGLISVNSLNPGFRQNVPISD